MHHDFLLSHVNTMRSYWRGMKMPLWWNTLFDLESKGTYESKIGELHVDRENVANLKGEFDASIFVGYSILWFGSRTTILSCM